MMEFLTNPITVFWIASTSTLLFACTAYSLYRVRIHNLLTLVLQILYTQRALRTTQIMQVLKEAGLSSPRTPLFFIQKACEKGIKKGWIASRGLATYQITAKGRTELNQTLGEDEWRQGKAKLPAQ